MLDTIFVCFIVWQETANCDRVVATGMCALSFIEEVKGVSAKHVGEMKVG